MTTQLHVPRPVDPALVPALSDAYAPVADERDLSSLSVVDELPPDLRGVYLRNGSNPLYPPLGSYTYPLDGDGMVHGIWIGDDGTVRYRNRFVWTHQLRAEQRAGKALWGGLLAGYMPGPDVVPAELADLPKALPDINIIRHAGRTLALAEVLPPWELTEHLETVGTGPYTWSGVIPGMCGHPKIDPRTGELVLFRYAFQEPYLMWAAIAPDGSVAHAPEPIPVDGPYMIHDFVLTERHVVLFAPAVFDLRAAHTGGDILAWRPERPLRIAVVPRQRGADPVRWLDTEPFWVWHFANGFDDGEDIVVVDFARFSALPLKTPVPLTAAITRARLEPANGRIRLDTLDERNAEFPRIDDRLQGAAHRFFTLSATERAVALEPIGQELYNVLLRVDTATGAIVEWHSGSHVFGEVVFAPAAGGAPDQGYYVTFRTDRQTLLSDWVVLDAANIAAGPLAVVPLPFRIPLGLHGNWFATSEQPEEDH
jgi:carotenoid cleavage dioxygenase